ncbi:MAG: hypothetical protein QNJ60_03170 [Xenococcaceae cyanobacterium MO_188.B19]|nr:hypothetical protein [Xenococcaceae cyanobacterium MO_188.B19]
MNFAKRIAKKFIRRKENWSIGIYEGSSLFDFNSPKNLRNPVLTARDVTDIPADFVADPFMLKENGIWYMFFEVMEAVNQKGKIGLATSHNGFDWTYQKIVIDEEFHLSYPYIFKWKNDYYLIPESNERDSIRLYKAVDFPTKWIFVKDLLSGCKYSDASIFHFQDKWWLLTSLSRSDVLYLYYANDLMGTWSEHPKSPVIEGNIKIARPGGRVVVHDDKIIRYTQDDENLYGNQVRAFEITELTTENYEEREVTQNPIIKASGRGWNKIGMHNIDPHKIDENKWIACVDGYRISVVFHSYKYYL